MCKKAGDNYPYALEFVSECCKTQKSVTKLLMLILPKYNLFLNAIRLKKCVTKQLIDIFCIWFYYW